MFRKCKKKRANWERIITETLIMNKNVRFDALIVFRCQINDISIMHMCICYYNGSLSALFRRRPISQGKFCLCKTVEHGDPPQRHPAALQTAGEQHICHTLPVRVCVC